MLADSAPASISASHIGFGMRGIGQETDVRQAIAYDLTSLLSASLCSR
jgi:hypothetical protein